MSEDMRFEEYILRKRTDKTYAAIVHLYKRTPRVVIPEEYDGIPITKITIDSLHFGSVLTVCVSKNVKIFMNSINLQGGSQQYFAEIDPENPWLIADDKAVFSKDKSILYAFTARSDESYTIPDGVKTIYNYAFYNANVLRVLNFPDGLEEIGDRAFGFCSVREWRLPNSIKKIGSRGFSCIRKANLFVLPDSIEEAAPDAFNRTTCASPVFLPDCYNRPEFDIPNFKFAPEYIVDENSRTLTVIDGVVYTKDMKTLLAVSQKAPDVITVPNGVEVIGNRACDCNKQIREVVLPRSVHTILNEAFFNSGLEKINLENVKFIKDKAFENCHDLIETGNIGARKIGCNCFSNCGSLGFVNLTDVREIGIGAFYGLKDNAKMFLPEGLKKVDGLVTFGSRFRSFRVPRSASMLDNIIPDYTMEIELYDVENSVIYKKDPGISHFQNGCLVKVLSPKTDKVKYAVKIFEAETTDVVKDPRKYINSLFGGEQFFDLKKYDEYFRTVFSRRHLLSKYWAAYYRIKYPAELTKNTRRMYMKYLEGCAADVVRHYVNKQDVTAEERANFPYLYAIGEKDLLELITHSAEYGLTEITLFLMNLKNELFSEPDNTEEGL